MGRVRFSLVAVALLVSLGPFASRLGVRAQGSQTTIVATSDAALRVWDSAVDRMTRVGELRARRTDADTLIAGRVHEHFDQYYKGIPVWGGGATRQTERGFTISIFGAIYSDIDLDVVPRLSIDDARGAVERLSGVGLGRSDRPELVVLPDDSGSSYRLVYRDRAFTTDRGLEYFIDANTGIVVREVDAAQRQAAAVGEGVGVLADQKKLSITSQAGAFFASDLLRPPLIETYDMQGSQARAAAALNRAIPLLTADLATSASTTWTDPVAVDAQAYQGFVYDFYFKRFGRRGLNGSDLRVTGLIHPARREDVFLSSSNSTFFCNAAYVGGGMIVYGEGFPAGVVLAGSRSCNYLAGGLDVVAHELTHGVTEFTSRLIYQNQSGALNEAFSDMMGTAAEFFFQPAGSGPLKADYLVAEDVVTPGGFRSMADPASLGQPDHFSKFVVRPNNAANDNGGVHTNSGIANHAYFLAIEGGTNRTSGLAVQGVGQNNREQIERTFYRGFTQLMPSNATFSVARAATVQAARDLYGAGSAVERAVIQAWTAVGVN